jgi:hypothetical protein
MSSSSDPPLNDVERDRMDAILSRFHGEGAMRSAEEVDGFFTAYAKGKRQSSQAREARRSKKSDGTILAAADRARNTSNAAVKPLDKGP